MTFLESFIRLVVVLLALIWLPGWLASRRPLWPIRVLHPAILGLTIHFGIVVAVVSASGAVDRVTGPVLGVTALAGAALALVRLRRGGAPAGPAALPVLPGLAVAVCVAGAALLRWFHNYHFDDLQHLRYLTEIERQGVLFPREFMLYVPWASTADQGLFVSRYPFWAAEYALLARFAGVPLGDAYYFLGLGVSALTLGLVTALLHDLLASRLAAVAGLLGLVMAGQAVAGDDLLNFGGYPFQSGKLFLFVAALALVAFVRRPEPRYLLLLGSGLFIAPLLHTNNIIGTVLVVTIALAAALVVGSRPLAATALCSTGAVALAGTIAVLSNGFMQFENIKGGPQAADVSRTQAAAVPLLPDNDRRSGVSAPQTARSRAPGLVGKVADYTILEYEGWYLGVPDALDVSWKDIGAIAAEEGVFRARSREDLERDMARGAPVSTDQPVQPAGQADAVQRQQPGNVLGRQALFLKRAMPAELLFPAVLVIGWMALRSRGREAFAGTLLAICGGAVLVHASSSLVRQVATTAFKPGYWSMRPSLMAVRDEVRGQPVLTDAITHVYGAAAGWTLPARAPVALEDQFRRLLMFHPATSAAVVDHLWAPGQERLLIVNEAVLGPSVGAKFEQLASFRLLRRVGDASPSAQSLAQRTATLARHVHSLDYVTAASELAAELGKFWRMLFRRPLYVLAAHSGPRDAPPDAVTRALDAYPDLPATGSAGSTSEISFLNTTMLRAAVPDGCYTGSTLEIEGLATFDSQVLVHVLPTGAAASHWIDSIKISRGQVASADVAFLEPVCGPGAVTFFIHGTHWYDFRFAVHGPEWTDGERVAATGGQR